MTAASNYLETAICNAVFRNTSYTSPTTVYVALYTSNPAEDNSGTEVSGNGYSRQSVTFGAPSNGVLTSNADVEFTASGGNFGTVTHFGIFDASSSGNLLVYGALGSSQAVNDGDTFQIASGNLTVTIA